MQLTKGAIGNLINRYKAVLKKCHLMNTFGSLAVAGMLIMGGAGVAVAADAQDVALQGKNNYNSTDIPEVNHLMGGWKVNDAATAGDAKGGITLTVNGGTISEIIGGSYAKNLPAAEDSKLLTVKHGDITTTISGDTTSAEFVVGGSKVAGGAGANLETGKTTLTITGGTFGTQKTDDYELVMGGNYAKTAGNSGLKAATEGSSVAVKGGTFHASVVGGSVAHNYSGNGSITVTDNGNTSVTIKGGTFNPSESNLADGKGGIRLSAAVIGGGLAYGANTNSVLGSKEAPVTSSVVINGGTFGPGANNGHYAKIVAGSVVANNGGTATVHGNTTLAMAGGAAHDDLIGGGMVENAAKLSQNSTPEYNLNITGDSSVKVTGGKALGEVIGGNYVKTSTADLENSAKVANSSVTITGGTFAGVNDSTNKAQYIIGGSKTNASGGGNATTFVEGNSSVLIDGNVEIKDGALIGGSQAKAGNGAQSEATAIVKGNSSVTVNNGTLAGVIGGGIAETYYTTATAKSTVDGTSFVTINGGKVTGNSIETGAVASNTRKLSAAVVGGGLANDKGSTATVGSTRVTIADGTINGKVVAGGAAANGGTTTVKGDTFLSMTDGTVKDDLVGGNLVDGSASTNTTFAQSSDVKGSTHVSLTGGNIDGEVVGGGYVRNANATANVEGDTYVTVSAKSGNNEPQAWVQYVIGGGKAMTNANGQVATAGVNGASHVLVEGDAAIGFGTVAGGGLARTQGNGGKTSANVSESNVEINGGTLAGVAGGGVAENYDNGTGTASALVTEANLIINDGTINTVMYAAQESEKASVVGGGIAWSKGGSADAGVQTANTVINGGSISRHVFAGGLADGAGATSQVDTANLTIRGGNLQGDIHAGGYAINGGKAEVSTATVTFDGTTDFAGKVIGQGHQDEQSSATVKDSTLAFSNYDGAFNGTVMAFDHISAAADSQVSMDVLDVTTAGHNNKLDINGAGTITAASVTVTNGTSLTVSDGGHLVAGDLNTQDTGSVMVEDLGSTLVVSNTNLDNLANKSLRSTAGSEIRLDGLADETSLADIKDKLAEDNTGIVNLGDTQITDLSELTQNGEISYEGWKQAGATGFTTDAIKGSTLTGVAGAKGSDDPEGIPPATRISGMAVSDVKLSSGTYLETDDSVTLTGLGNGSQFVSREDGSLGGAFVYGTLTLGDTAYTGTKYISYIGFGSDARHTLNTLGADRDSSRIVVTSDIRGGEGKDGTINATDVTLQVSGNIGQDISAVPAKQDKLDINANDANILVGGSILAENVSLQNASLLHADKDLAIKGNLFGQGAVVADKTLTLTKDYDGAEGDDLTLQAETLKTAAINSTDGDLAIAATNLVTTGATTLVDDTLVADNVALGGVLTASGASLVQVQDFGKYETSSGTFTPGALDKAVSVTDQSLMVYGAGAEQAQQAVAETGHNGAAYYAGKELKLVNGGSLTVGNATATTTVAFGSDSLLVVDGTAMNGKTVFTGAEGSSGLTASVAEGSKLHVDNAVAGGFTVFGDGFTSSVTGWADENVTTDSAMLDASYDENKVTVTTNDAHTVFPNLSDGMADAVNDLYNGKLNNVDSTDMGVRFLSRATNDHFLGADKDAAAATIESAARIAFAGAVPQMTKMASDAATNAVVNRLGFANPADGAQAMDAEGKIVDRNTTGFALWIAPLWQSQHGWGMEADNLDYGFNGNLGGVSLGADYTFENAIRAGITFNIGGGYAESSGGDLNSTENRMSFWGLGAYAGWNYENFGLMADVSYTSTWNDLKQDMDSRMGMGDLEADVQASAISAGLRAEYKLETSVLDVIPHIGVRYMSLNTWGFDAESNGGTVLEGDGFHQDIWTFPVGVTFTKDFTLDSGWSFKPSIDFSVIPAAGDIKAKQDVAFTGLPGSYEVETQMMDYLTWQGGVGLEMGNDTMSFGVNYTLQAGQHTTGHGVFGSFRYEF